MKKHREAAKSAESELDKAMKRFKKASTENRELVRSLVPPDQRVEDTRKFSILPPPKAEAG